MGSRLLGGFKGCGNFLLARLMELVQEYVLPLRLFASEKVRGLRGLVCMGDSVHGLVETNTMRARLVREGFQRAM